MNDNTRSPKRPSTDCVIDDGATTAKRKCNDSKCPICLNAYSDASLIRACGHIFCFDCIGKWVAQKPNCPLCKKRVDFIKHNFRRTHTFEPNWSDNGTVATARGIIEEEEFKRLSEHTWPLDSELELIDGAVDRLNSMIGSSNIDILKQVAELKINLQKLRYCSEKKSRLDFIRNSLFRFVVYFMDADRHSLITTHTDVTINTQYVRENRAQLRSELVPFVAREIHAITGLEAINIEQIMDLLLNAFENWDLKKDNLFSYLKSIGVDHPRTFYRLVFEFASADQSLELYDSNSRYKLKTGLGPLFTDDNEIQVLPTSTTLDNDIQFVGVSRMARTDPQVITLT